MASNPPATTSTTETTRPAHDWEVLTGIEIRDPDGWRSGVPASHDPAHAGLLPRGFTQSLTREEFILRAMASTVTRWPTPLLDEEPSPPSRPTHEALNPYGAAMDMLASFRDSLPRDHPDRTGVIRCIELLRAEGVMVAATLPTTPTPEGDAPLIDTQMDEALQGLSSLGDGLANIRKILDSHVSFLRTRIPDPPLSRIKDLADAEVLKLLGFEDVSWRWIDDGDRIVIKPRS